MKPIEFWTWEYTDALTGRRARTRWKARPDSPTLAGLVDLKSVPGTMEIREVPETPGEMEGLSGGAAVRIGMEQARTREPWPGSLEPVARHSLGIIPADSEALGAEPI